jgi:hypothetical protein
MVKHITQFSHHRMRDLFDPEDLCRPEPVTVLAEIGGQNV